MPNARWPDAVWYGDGAVAAAARAVLTPLSLAYGAVVAARGRLYDHGVLAVHETAVPCLSVGNLSVGGTGKTPVAAWMAATLLAKGARPAIVLRGYGEDEPLVHRLLNREVPVIVDADRVAGAARAREAGCDVAVLDDAFQHRRARRVADIVLVSADRIDATRQVLPSGPYREPLRALRRAHLVIVTRKFVSRQAAAERLRALQREAPGVPGTIVHLATGPLRQVGSEAMEPSDVMHGKDVLAIAAIADPTAFSRQIGSFGPNVTLRAFRDHHRFTPADVERLAGESSRHAMTVCTLKDAVKLAPLWPRVASPLWYVSQHLALEEGGEAVEALLQRVLDARPTNSSSNAG